MNPTLNDHHLRLFVDVARARSLRSAALKLGVTQPALSKQIKALEASLSMPLFRRDGRGMELTALGQQLFQAVGHRYDQIDTAFETVAAVARGCGSRVAIATVNTLSAYLMPDAVSRLKARDAGVALSLVNASSPEVVERVEKGLCDLGLVYDTAVDTDAFIVHPLHMETLAGFCAADAAPPSALGREQLRDAPLILPPKTYALRRAFERELGHEPRTAIECNSVSMALDMAARGFGMAILPHHLPESMTGARGLKRVEIFDGRLRRQVVAITRRSDRLSEIQQHALDAVQHCAQRLCVAPPS